MAISRASMIKELIPGLNALFGLEYARYDNEHEAIYDTETSDRSFEEEVKLVRLGAAPVKAEGSAITYDVGQESYTSRYTHETVALGFAITEEAIEDNLYTQVAGRYTKGLARAMAHTKQVKGAYILNNAYTSSAFSIAGAELCASRTTAGGYTVVNKLSTAADLAEASLETAAIDIANFVDERGLVAVSFDTRWEVLFDKVLQARFAGEEPETLLFLGMDQTMELADGTVESAVDIMNDGKVGIEAISPKALPLIPQEIVDLVEQRREQMMAGEWDPFTEHAFVSNGTGLELEGLPIPAAGTEVKPAGETPDDVWLLSQFNFDLEGMQILE